MSKHIAGTIIAILAGLAAVTLQAQSLLELTKDGKLQPAPRPDVTIILSRPDRSAAFYSLQDDGSLTGTRNIASIEQEPGSAVPLTTSPGRRLEVIGTRVNVRKDPGIDADVLTQLQKGAQVYSEQHAGNWVQVSDAASGDLFGWIYEPLLAEVFGLFTPPVNSPLAKFRRQLSSLQEAPSSSGFYRGLDSVMLSPEGWISLRASEDWLEYPAADRWRAAGELGSAWRSLADSRDVAVLNIIDENGRRRMTVIRP